MKKGYQQLYFQDCCCNGNLNLAKKLTKTYNLTSDNAQSLANFALRGTCTFGHTLVAQWLVETFKLTINDIRSENNYALQHACENGHTSTAEWLLDTFYTSEDALKTSSNEKISPEIKKWLQNYKPFGAFTKPVKM
jgi:hypothetical protein